jgi:hypothetical protein
MRHCFYAWRLTLPDPIRAAFLDVVNNTQRSNFASKTDQFLRFGRVASEQRAGGGLDDLVGLPRVLADLAATRHSPESD